MFFLPLLMYTNVLGGFSDIDLDNDYVTHAKTNLQSKMNAIFPEITNAELIITSAQIKIVKGAILNLTCKYAQFEFEVQITFPLRQEPVLTAFKPLPKTALRGGYYWIDIEENQEEIQNVINSAVSNKYLTSTPHKVLAARAQTLRGSRNVQVIFQDDENSLYSVVSNVFAEKPEISLFAKL
ncbi:hypothetical protein GPJ56_001250 [Histomonas meleagridis]|uniref:uncharacterized protein n=1 Tax=Histomonas meleagridis TaxID=135588 RepID=UPI00355A1BE2|nr:hypothetical protein GPJ56_001250 [Histomonas meleagridis]KAH0797620.1 hypothetical protein GO595_009249 [Histomonas meleagridis]